MKGRCSQCNTWKSLGCFFFFFCRLSTSTALPPTFIFCSPPFPSIQPSSPHHPWSGGPSLWEVKGHLGWECSQQVVWALRSPFPTACVKRCWTLTLPRLRSQNLCETQFMEPDPIHFQTFHWRRKESHPSQLWSVPFFCLLVKQGRTTVRH